MGDKYAHDSDVWSVIGLIVGVFVLYWIARGFFIGLEYIGSMT